MASTLIGKQAVVIGAGMGGLTAAGALADRFDQVVVLERDTLPLEPAYRAGTPQARHVHALLLSGQRALSELFPGFEQDLARAGAVPLRAGLDVRMERPGYDPFPQRDLGWFSYAVSRPTIERAVRRRVESRANTTLRQRCRVQEVLASPNGEAVTGVRYENGNGASETIAVHLVVDASGRGALTLALLQSIGRPLPEETTIGIDLGYATMRGYWPRRRIRVLLPQPRRARRRRIRRHARVHGRRRRRDPRARRRIRRRRRVEVHFAATRRR